MFDEIKESVDLINNKKEGRVLLKDLQKIAMYYDGLDANSEDIEKKLKEYISTKQKKNNQVEMYEKIKICLSTITRFKLRENNPIEFSKQELDKIKSGGGEISKILFIMSCIAKYYYNNQKLKAEPDGNYEKKFRIKSPNYSDIKKLSKIKISNDDLKKDMIHKLSEIGAINIVVKKQLMIDMLWLDKNIEEHVLKFKCHDDMILHYLLYIGEERIKECDVCGNLYEISLKDRCSKYCKSCARIIKNEQNKSYLGKAKN